VQWVSESFPAASNDQGIMGGKCRQGGTHQNFYQEIFDLYPLGLNGVPYISADAGYTHPDLLIPAKGRRITPEQEAQKTILRGIGNFGFNCFVFFLMFHFTQQCP